MTQSLKVLTWNIQAAIGTTQFSHYFTRAHHQFLDAPVKRERLAEISRVLQDYDVCCIQEVDLGGRRSGFSCQVEQLAKLSGHAFIAKQENRTIPGISRHGNAILSRIPFEDVHDIKLPGKVKGRGALMARLEHPSKLTLGCVHLSLGKVDQTEQFNRIASHLPSGHPYAVMGDFNCEATATHFRDFLQKANACMKGRSQAPTYPSWHPKRDLDHVIVSRNVSLTHYEVLPERFSDHLPVSVKLSV